VGSLTNGAGKLCPAPTGLTSMTHTAAGELTLRLQSIRQRIAQAAGRSGRRADEIKLVAVSKTRPAGDVLAAFRAGQKAFGENRVQEALAKMDELASGDNGTDGLPESPAGMEWHLVGHLQTNKARLVVGRFAWIHSVDSERLALTLERHGLEARQQPGLEARQHPPALITSPAELNALIQVNWSGEETKAGVRDWDSLCRLVETLAPMTYLIPRGLMCVPDPAFDETQTRSHFALVRELAQRVSREFGLKNFTELSMGMTHDFEWAVEEGATLVRVGTALFGERS